MANQTYGTYEDADGLHAFTVADLDTLSESEKVQMMVAWFHAHFEDPAVRTPYESREGGYQWIWGGPHSADEELQDEFSDVIDFETIQQAVQTIENDGLIEWAPQPSANDYDDINASEAEVVDGDAVWPPIIAVEPPGLSEPEARSEVIRRLDRLEELIRPLVSPAGTIGHNNPPESIDIEYPCSRDEWLTLNQAINVIQEQTRLTAPDVDRVSTGANVLASLAKTLGHWIKVRAEKGLDAAIVVIAGALGAKLVVDVQTILDDIGVALQSLSEWISVLPSPF